MAGYFSYFPKIAYTLSDNSTTLSNSQLVTNIFTRSKFLSDIANNSSVYFKYSIKDSDTPEIIADKIYGDPYRSWIILLFNNFINPMYEFPLKTDPLNTFIQNKYSQTIEEAQSEIHHYEQEITKVVSLNGTTLYTNVDTFAVSTNEYNFATNTLTPRTVPGVADTSLIVNIETLALQGNQVLTITTKNKAISNYAYEINENEKRREIVLLDPHYITQVEREFKKLMSNG